MSIDVQSFAGHPLNDATYRARLLADALPRARAVAPVLNRPTGQFPHIVRSDPQEITLQLAVELLDPTTANVEQLMARLAPGTEGALVVSFDGTDRAIDCVVQGIAPYAGAPNHFTATLSRPTRAGGRP